MRMCLFSNLFFSRKIFFENVAHQILRRRFCSQDLTENKVKKKLEYILILDFEATCDKVKLVQEIIEFPCLKINVETHREQSRFHRYVRPIVNPHLTDFCISLTGILQEMVDCEETFPNIFKSFEDWRQKEGLNEENSLYLTSGDWDLGHMIPQQCQLSNLQIPPHMMEWIDIKKLYANNFNVYNSSLMEMMKAFNFEFEGRMHSGIDDCLNIYKIVRKMLDLGIKFVPTSKLELSDKGPHVLTVGARKFTLSKRNYKAKNFINEACSKE